MNLRRSSSFIATSWVVILALAVSPLMAQDPQSAPLPAQDEETRAAAPQVHEFKITPAGSTFSPLAGSSTSSSAALPEEKQKSDAPGQTKWVILAALIGAGAVTGIILLLRGWGGGDSQKTGTIISAGEPSVAAPAR
jgi:hypothetical protein